MFRKIRIARYKSIEYVEVPLSPFNVLVGPNASGKSSFLDSLTFIQDALGGDVEHAIRKRAGSLRELVWSNQADKGFEIALEVELPANLRTGSLCHIRYEAGIGLGQDGAIAVTRENLQMLNGSAKSGGSSRVDLQACKLGTGRRFTTS
jgi:Predicted ATPase